MSNTPAQLVSNINQYPRLLASLQLLSETDKQAHFRNLCLTDLYFFLRYALHRPDVESDWLFARCREVQETPNECLDLWAREHYKSTVITFALTIQDILNDPELTVAIFSHTRPMAKTFLKQIKNELENNTLLKELFPDILWQNPQRESPKWNEDEGLIVRRLGNPKEGTLEAWGVIDGQPIGKHFARRVYDDVITADNVTNPEQVRKTIYFLQLSQDLGKVGGAARYIGTRYTLNDPYAELISRGSVTPRIHTATHDGRYDGRPVLFSPAEWEKRKKERTRFLIAAQYLQNPLADEEATFQIPWLRPYEVRPKTLNVFIMADPSRGRSATSDNTAISVIGLSATGSRYLLDGYCHKMTLSQRWTALRDLYKKWSAAPGVNHVSVGYERYGQQSDDEYFQEQMLREKIVFPIIELSWTRDGTNSKRERVERLEPDFRNSRFYLPLPMWRDGRPTYWAIDREVGSHTEGTIMYYGGERNPETGKWEAVTLTNTMKRAVQGGEAWAVARALSKRDASGKLYDLTARFIEEYCSFPFGAHDDLIDATSRFYDMDPLPPASASKYREPAVYWDS